MGDTPIRSANPAASVWTARLLNSLDTLATFDEHLSVPLLIGYQ
jgi:hypothetical protein